MTHGAGDYLVTDETVFAPDGAVGRFMTIGFTHEMDWSVTLSFRLKGPFREVFLGCGCDARQWRHMCTGGVRAESTV